MGSIQVEVSKEVIDKFGLAAIKLKLQQMLEWEKLKILAEEVQTEVNKAGLDHHSLMEEARTKAWQEFRAKYLKDVLP